MYTFSGRIRYSETNQEGYLKIESLIDYFQDCSTFQSEDLGIGIEYLTRDHLAWMVNAWQLDILRLPRLGERIVVGTSPYELKGFMGLRNFMLETADGERLVSANSIWSLFNMEKGVPERVTQKIASSYELAPKFDMEYLPRKIAVPEEGGVPEKEILITEQFLDSNHHVNNGQYVRLAMAFCPKGQAVSRVRVEYKKQAYLGEIIVPVVFRRPEGKTLICLNSPAKETYACVELR
jgi:medium-chain acyl-[acyl-carrier-protein] hydrolase